MKAVCIVNRKEQFFQKDMLLELMKLYTVMYVGQCETAVFVVIDP